MRALHFAPPLPADDESTDETVAPLSETSPDAGLFREMADKCPLGLLVHQEFKPVYVNAAWAAIFGYSAEEIMAGETFCDLAHEADHDRLRKYGVDRMKGLYAPDRYRFRAHHKDGRTIWLEQFVKVVAWQDQPAIMVVTVDVDSEERQTARLRRQQTILEQTALEQSEALTESSRELHVHQSIVDQVSELMSVVDTDYRYRLVNRAYLDFFGLCQEQVVGRHVQDILGEELFSTCAKPMIERAFEGRHNRSEKTLSGPDGRHRHIECVTEPFREPDGTISGAICSLRDVTAVRIVERQRHLFASVIEQSSDRVSVIDRNYCFLMTNRANSEFHRCAEGEIIGRPLIEFVGEDYFYRFSKPSLDRCFEGEEVRFRRPHRDQHGYLGTIEILLEPFRQADGSIIGAIARLRDVTEAQAMSEKLAYQARYDQLTGLPNRPAFEQILEKSIADVATSGRTDVLCFIDLDQFKIVNDTVGHLAGDMFLKQVAELLTSKLHDDDVLARFGGDEFVLLLRKCSLRRAERACECLIAALTDQRFFHEGLVFRMGASIGITAINRHATSAGDMMVQADLACYAAKDNGRNQVQIYKPRDAFIRRRQDDMYRAGRIRAALDEDRFVLFGQTIAPVRPEKSDSGHIEILLRQIDRGMKIIDPDAFIPAAERYGLMAELDRWVIQKTVNCLTRPCEALLNKNVSINLSGVTLSDETSLDFIRKTLTRSGLAPERISFEVTETAAIQNLMKTEGFMAELREWGCRFALDDFGSGLSSLSYLKRLPVDFLKIDGSFIRELATDPTSHAMVKAIIQMAKDLNIKTIAEGVESLMVLNVLKALGVDYVQGYAIDLPAPLHRDVTPVSGAGRVAITSSRRR